MASIEPITSNNDLQQEEIESHTQKLLKTQPYTLEAIKRYKTKNPDKIKQYNANYRQKQKDEKKKHNPYIDFTKQQLYDKIFELESQIKTLQTMS